MYTFLITTGEDRHFWVLSWLPVTFESAAFFARCLSGQPETVSAVELV